MENENSVISKVDVRVIVSGLDIAEVVSKSVDNTQLENDYNIIVSSIIPTNNFEIAKKSSCWWRYYSHWRLWPG